MEARLKRWYGIGFSYSLKAPKVFDRQKQNYEMMVPNGQRQEIQKMTFRDEIDTETWSRLSLLNNQTFFSGCSAVSFVPSHLPRSQFFRRTKDTAWHQHSFSARRVLVPILHVSCHDSTKNERIGFRKDFEVSLQLWWEWKIVSLYWKISSRSLIKTQKTAWIIFCSMIPMMYKIVLDSRPKKECRHCCCWRLDSACRWWHAAFSWLPELHFLK